MIKKISRILFVIYLLLIPIRLIFPFSFFFHSPLSYIASSNSFILLFLGLLIILLDSFSLKIRKNKKVLYFFYIIFLLNLLSVINAFFVYIKYGDLNGENSFNAILGLIILYFQVGFIVLYNTFLIPNFSIKFFKNIFNIYYFMLLISGYLQIILLLYPNLNIIYDSINLFSLMRSSQFILTINRISGIGSEPASLVGITSFLVIPSELSKFLEKKSLFNLLKIVILVPVIYFTLSSTVYIAFLINFVIFSYFYFKSIIFHHKFLFLITIITLCLIFFSIIPPDVSYYIFDKVFDTQNMSTAYRTSTLINDFYVFLKYPLFGIGNGNQGYYFNSINWASYFFRSQEFVNAYNGDLGIINGGSFLPAFISGYGIFGILIIITFFSKLFKNFKALFYKTFIYYYSLISIFTFLMVSVLSTDIVGNYSILLSLSFLFINKKIL